MAFKTESFNYVLVPHTDGEIYKVKLPKNPNKPTKAISYTEEAVIYMLFTKRGHVKVYLKASSLKRNIALTLIFYDPDEKEFLPVKHQAQENVKKKNYIIISTKSISQGKIESLRNRYAASKSMIQQKYNSYKRKFTMPELKNLNKRCHLLKSNQLKEIDQTLFSKGSEPAKIISNEEALLSQLEDFEIIMYLKKLSPIRRIPYNDLINNLIYSVSKEARKYCEEVHYQNMTQLEPIKSIESFIDILEKRNKHFNNTITLCTFKQELKKKISNKLLSYGQSTKDTLESGTDLISLVPGIESVLVNLWKLLEVLVLWITTSEMDTFESLIDGTLIDNSLESLKESIKINGAKIQKSQTLLNEFREEDLFANRGGQEDAQKRLESEQTLRQSDQIMDLENFVLPLTDYAERLNPEAIQAELLAIFPLPPRF